MLLKYLILTSMAFSSFSWGSELDSNFAPIYRLKSFTKILRGQARESKTGRAQFCGEQIHPKVINRDGKKWVELNAKLGFEWRNIEETPQPMDDGCSYPVIQKVDSRSLVLINDEVCPGKRKMTGSTRETLQLNDQEIRYGSETVIKQGQQWVLDTSKESFVCVWTPNSLVNSDQ